MVTEFRGRSIEHVDRRTIHLTIVLVTLALLAALFRADTIGDLLASFASLLTTSLFLVGLYVVFMRGWSELRMTRILLRLAPWSIASCAVTITAILLLVQPSFVDSVIGDVQSFNIPTILLTGAVGGVVLGTAMLMILVFDVILCYGVNGIIAAMTKRLYPDLLGNLRHIDTSCTLSIRDRLTLWLFAIGTLVLLYISLNLLLDLELAWAVGLVSSLSVLIPAIVLPLFPLRAVSAELEAPVRPFALFDGVKARMGG